MIWQYPRCIFLHREVSPILTPILFRCTSTPTGSMCDPGVGDLLVRPPPALCPSPTPSTVRCHAEEVLGHTIRHRLAAITPHVPPIHSHGQAPQHVRGHPQASAGSRRHPGVRRRQVRRSPQAPAADVDTPLHWLSITRTKTQVDLLLLSLPTPPRPLKRRVTRTTLPSLAWSIASINGRTRIP